MTGRVAALHFCFMQLRVHRSFQIIIMQIHHKAHFTGPYHKEVIPQTITVPSFY